MWDVKVNFGQLIHEPQSFEQIKMFFCDPYCVLTDGVIYTSCHVYCYTLGFTWSCSGFFFFFCSLPARFSLLEMFSETKSDQINFTLIRTQ